MTDGEAAGPSGRLPPSIERDRDAMPRHCSCAVLIAVAGACWRLPAARSCRRRPRRTKAAAAAGGFDPGQDGRARCGRRRCCHISSRRPDLPEVACARRKRCRRRPAQNTAIRGSRPIRPGPMRAGSKARSSPSTRSRARRRSTSTSTATARPTCACRSARRSAARRCATRSTSSNFNALHEPDRLRPVRQVVQHLCRHDRALEAAARGARRHDSAGCSAPMSPGAARDLPLMTPAEAEIGPAP